jgi:hypothetical protein
MSEQPKTTVLTRVNCLIKVPGYAEAFAAANMRFNPEARSLVLLTPHGTVEFNSSDDIQVELMDLEMPTTIRNEMKNDGWERMKMSTVIKLLNYTFLSGQ